MSIVLTILDHQADPMQGDQAAVLSMSFAAGKGYRFKAVAHPSQRELGRWVSDCPLAAYENAMLWLARFQWSVQQTPEIQEMLSQVGGMAPLNPQVHPLQAIAILSRNLQAPGSVDFPGDILVSFGGQQGAPRQLPGPVSQPSPPQRSPAPDPYAQAAAQRGVVPGVQRGVAPTMQGEPMAPPLSQEPEPRARIGEEEREVAMFLREAIEALKEGQRAEDVAPVVREFFGMGSPLPGPDGQSDDYDEFLDDIDDLIEEDDEFDESLFDGLGEGEGDGEESDLWDEEDEEEEAKSPQYRAVGVDEVPEGMDPEDAANMVAMTDPGAMEKMERTRNRQSKHLQHVYAVVNANEKAAASKASKKEALDGDVMEAKAITEIPEVPTNGGGHPTPIPVANEEESIREPLKATPPAKTAKSTASAPKKRRASTRKKADTSPPKRRAPSKAKGARKTSTKKAADA